MKPDERRSALAARRALSAEQRRKYSAAISQRLLSLPELENARTVFSYLPSWDEVDITFVNTALESRGVTVAYPVCLGMGQMEAHVPESAEALLPGAYGIKAPDPARSRLVAPAEIDVVLVPCVAFDEGRNRLGHGAGYYDRYLPRCPGAKLICVAFEAQRLDSVTTDEYDTKMDMVITELAGY